MPQCWIVTVCRMAADPQAEAIVTARWLVAAETREEAERAVRASARTDHVCRIDPAPSGEIAALGIPGSAQ